MTLKSMKSQLLSETETETEIDKKGNWPISFYNSFAT